MTHEEFEQQVLKLTPTEEKIMSGEFSQQEFRRQVLWGSKKDARGYYFFPNSKMIYAPEKYDLRFPLTHTLTGNNLRLLIHTRFTEIPFSYCEFVGIHYVYSGQMRCRFPEEEEFVLHEGDLLIINSNVPSSFSLESKDDIAFGIQIQQEYLKKELLYGISGNSPIADFLIKTLFGEKTDFYYERFSFSNMPRMKDLLIDMFCEYLDPSVCGKELIDDYMHIFFIFLIRGSDTMQQHQDNRNVLDMLRYIEQHGKTCSLEHLAAEFQYSSKYVSNLLKKKTGRTFSDLLIHARMKSVCFLLENTDKSIQDIAEECGYSNQTFFYRKFREIYHEGPKEYRKRMKGNTNHIPPLVEYNSK